MKFARVMVSQTALQSLFVFCTLYRCCIYNGNLLVLVAVMCTAPRPSANLTHYSVDTNSNYSSQCRSLKLLQ